ncbi:BMP family lipoprotein [Maridesulfovibrio zosterae]|uniref:BMP family lipoprotein n=1 Tax=Maridesulfovibrio zosterae TaxID=82171 RepID=UPI0003F8AC23|nr:BMP family ABC transporter substrate-binding protein [Maridesulfovibrio zosterae]
MGRYQVNLMILSKVMLVFCICLYPVYSHANSDTVGFLVGGLTLDDDSFNGITISGLRRLQNERHLNVVVCTTGEERKDVPEKINSLLLKGCGIIVINSSANHDLILEFIKKHPEVYFIINDAKIDGYKNVSSIYFGQFSGSCLVGALCGWQTKTGRVGFIGGNEHYVIKDFLNGFKYGVKLSGNDVEIDVKYVWNGNLEKGYEDPKKANIIAKQMYTDGADIIYAVAGLSGNGVIQAARNSGNYVVGVDSDQDDMAKGFVLTSMMKRLDLAVYQEVLSILDGNFVPGIKMYDLSNGGVALSEMKYTRHLISSDVLDKIEDLRVKLISGEIHPDCSVK